MSKWTGRTATEIAQAVRAGQVTPREVVAEHLDRIGAVNDRINAFVTIRREQALAEADRVVARADLADLPLAGVPVAIKDNVAVAGEIMRFGSLATSDEPQSADHAVVQRLRAAGAVVVGMTAVPDLGIFGTTDALGRVTRSPWDLGRTAGGSSGGSAAAVAAALVPLAHGNDAMGSIRGPAACCGLVGIKPGLGVVPTDVGPTSWYGTAENGALATTVADAAVGLAVMAGRPELAVVGPPEATLRVAVSTRSPAVGMPTAGAQAATAVRAGEVLSGAGHRVTDEDPRYPAWLAQSAMARWTAGAADAADGLPRADLPRRTRVHTDVGRLMRRASVARWRDVQRWQAIAGEFFERHDVLITPALAHRPAAAVKWSSRGWLANVVSNAWFTPFHAPWNLAQYPAVTVPHGVDGSGFPLAVQVVVPTGQEMRALAVAAQLEQLRPWARHAPDLTAPAR